MADCEQCGGRLCLANECGAWVCDDCEHHQGLARCYCGWSASGGHTGRQELQAMGETIEPEDDGPGSAFNDWNRAVPRNR